MADKKFNFFEPFKNIPNTLKGFPKNFIRMWKEPVKNNKEVEQRKSEILPLLYVFVILFVLLAVLSAIIQKASDILMIIGMIPGLGAVACVFLLIILKKAKEKYTDIECSKCHTQIKYGPDVIIKELGTSFIVTKKNSEIKDGNGIPVQATINAMGKEKTELEITCKCQECGEVKTFKHTFVTCECEKGAVKILMFQAVLCWYSLSRMCETPTTLNSRTRPAAHCQTE